MNNRGGRVRLRSDSPSVEAFALRSFAPQVRSRPITLKEIAIAATDFILARARTLPPGIFASVMATGIVSVACHEQGLLWGAKALFALNFILYAALLGLTGLRLVRFRRALLADLVDPARGVGFLTIVAGSCVLGGQCVLIAGWLRPAFVLWAFGALTWMALLYGFFAAVITARTKPGFVHGINGGWLVLVVATQSVVVLLVVGMGAGDARWLFPALCIWLLGDALYVPLIIFILYRLVFLPLKPRDFTPPYWIDMGALAITTLAGSLIVRHAPTEGPLAALMPFVKSSTLLFWSVATAWIPLLCALEVWRYVFRRVPFRYERGAWDVVFPLGMYTVATQVLSEALHLRFLRPVPEVGVWVSLAAWAIVAFGAVGAHVRPAGNPAKTL